MEFDQLGIEKKYKDSSRSDKSKDWFMGIDDWKDRIPLNKWIGNNGDNGTFHETSGKTFFEWDASASENVRLNVKADKSGDISTLNRKELALKKDSDNISRGGYMSSSSDWRDVEITCYLYLFDIGGNDTLGWYARGGRHGGNAPSCEGCKYEPNLFYKNGDFGVNKETDHGGSGSGDNHRKKGSDYGKLTIPDGLIGNKVGKWFGYKAVIYNLPSNGHYVDANDVPVYPVKIELWIDETDGDGDTFPFTPKNNFIKKMETFDNPLDSNYALWGDNGGCGGPDGITASWGGPVVTFRADKNSDNDGYKHFKMAYASVREIEPGVRTS